MQTVGPLIRNGLSVKQSLKPRHQDSYMSVVLSMVLMHTTVLQLGYTAYLYLCVKVTWLNCCAHIRVVSPQTALLLRWAATVSLRVYTEFAFENGAEGF